MIVPVEPRSGPILLGRAGENGARTIRWSRELPAWRAAYGEGTVVLLHQRARDAAPYPAASVVVGDNIDWLVTSADTAQPGHGKCELQYLVGGVVVKSKVWATSVASALSEPGEAPEPQQGWVEQLLEQVRGIVEEGGDTLPAGGEAGQVLGVDASGTGYLWPQIMDGTLTPGYTVSGPAQLFVVDLDDPHLGVFALPSKPTWLRIVRGETKLSQQLVGSPWLVNVRTGSSDVVKFYFWYVSGSVYEYDYLVGEDKWNSTHLTCSRSEVDALLSAKLDAPAEAGDPGQALVKTEDGAGWGEPVVVKDLSGSDLYVNDLETGIYRLPNGTIAARALTGDGATERIVKVFTLSESGLPALPVLLVNKSRVTQSQTDRTVWSVQIVNGVDNLTFLSAYDHGTGEYGPVTVIQDRTSKLYASSLPAAAGQIPVSSSTAYQSVEWVDAAALRQLPAVTAADNGKVAMVVDGAWGAEDRLPHSLADVEADVYAEGAVRVPYMEETAETLIPMDTYKADFYEMGNCYFTFPGLQLEAGAGYTLSVGGQVFDLTADADGIQAGEVGSLYPFGTVGVEARIRSLLCTFTEEDFSYFCPIELIHHVQTIRPISQQFLPEILTPLVGTTDEITPAMAAEAVCQGRSLAITLAAGDTHFVFSSFSMIGEEFVTSAIVIPDGTLFLMGDVGSGVWEPSATE